MPPPEACYDLGKKMGSQASSSRSGASLSLGPAESVIPRVVFGHVNGGNLNPGERHSHVTQDDSAVMLCTLRAATVLSRSCCTDFGHPLTKPTNTVPLTGVWNPPFRFPLPAGFRKRGSRTVSPRFFSDDEPEKKPEENGKKRKKTEKKRKRHRSGDPFSEIPIYIPDTSSQILGKCSGDLLVWSLGKTLHGTISDNSLLLEDFFNPPPPISEASCPSKKSLELGRFLTGLV